MVNKLVRPFMLVLFRRFLVFSFISVLLGCTRREELYKVVKVKDGDTIELLSPDHKNITVRLAEVDCPEKGQAYGQAAKQFTAGLCFGKSVELIGSEHDRYGRTIGKIILENGTNVNYALVKSGFAWQYRAYSKSMELAEMEQQARENKLGLWQDEHPTPPWDFRKTEKGHRGSYSKRYRSKSSKKYRGVPDFN